MEKVITGKYGVYFPRNGKTEETSYGDGEFESMESMLTTSLFIIHSNV